MQMLPKLVEYLKANGAAFRLASYPSPEPEPPVAHAVRPPGALVLDTHLLLIDGRLTLACVPRGEKVNVPGLRATIPAEIVAVEETNDALPSLRSDLGRLIPPFGRLFGLPLLVDEAVTLAPVICFEAFTGTDFVEMAYDDFARIEQPRVAAVAMAGELPPARMQ
jgi:Ala-tRNA(Pro) deacylase